jgi:HlyD family secretion protein
MIKTRLLRSWIVFALAVGAILATGCGAVPADQNQPETELVTVERGSLERSITAVGSVRARTEIALSFEAAGRVDQILVQAGEQVSQGQSLARLDTADLELQLRSTEAALASAEAQMAQLEAGPRPEELRIAQGQVEVAQAALDQATAQRDQLLSDAPEAEIAAARATVSSARASYNRVRAGPSAEELAQAQAALESAQAAVRQAQASYDRIKGRADAGMLPETLALENATIELQRAQANYDALVNQPTPDQLAAAAAQVAEAEARLAQLEASMGPQLQVAEAGVTAAQAQRNIAQAQLDLLRAGPTAAEIATAEAQVQQAQVAVDSAQLALDRATLVAPLAGTLARIEVERGESVNPNVPVMTLVGDSPFAIEADVDEADIGWIAEGQPVRITFDAFPEQELAGEVVSIAPLASVDLGIVSYRVTIESVTTSLSLRAGMTANVEIVQERREDVLLVPNEAIALDPNSGRKFVEKKTPSGSEQVEITTGLTTDIYSEVLSGLEEGAQVVLSSVSFREQFRDLLDSSFPGGEGQ